ncbi:acyl-CoA dehydrogenase [Kutzneria viridogrisea]|uniref:Acyl-[acyl-carrier-protein] dehydrogenase MbtN n=1 Tax=Kutzneria viridogrisea TaxID=47990 RepID=A0ABR6B8J7_9PSEU|nr:acyl-CoA dehydrogenase [Kutzneria viridogrisea]
MSEDLGLPELRELAKSFWAKEVTPHQPRWRAAHQVDRELWTTAGGAGLLCVGVPEPYGGGGGSFAHEVVLAEEQARAGDTSWGRTAHDIVARYLLLHGTERQKTRWLPRMAAGELVGALAITEPDAGSDVQAITTRARRVAGGYLLHGAKTFVTNGIHSGLVLVLAKVADPERRTPPLSLFVLETAGLPGLHRGPALEKIGLHGQDTAELFLDGVELTAEHLLGEVEGRGLAQLLPLISRERLLIAVTSVAVMETALAETVRYCKQRRAFSRPLMRFQNTQFVLAGAAAQVAASRALLDSTVAAELVRGASMAEVALAKLWCTERLGEVLDSCLQLFGGYGYMSEYPVARAWADARVARIFGGTNEIMREIVAASLGE